MKDDGRQIGMQALVEAEWTLESETKSLLFRRLMNAGVPLKSAIEGKILYGIKTGLNEAFVIDQQTKLAIVRSDPSAAELIRPLATGQDMRPWYVEQGQRWLVTIPSGWSHRRFGESTTEQSTWEQFKLLHPSLASHLEQFEIRARNRTDQGDFWWELRPCDYYDAFERSKLVWPDIAKLPRFSRDTEGYMVNDTGFILPCDDPFLLSLLQSRVSWYVTSQMNQPLRLRGGLWQYRLKSQFIERLPIPAASSADKVNFSNLANSLSNASLTRYRNHLKSCNRIHSDFGTPDAKLNQKLTACWTLDFSECRAEIKKVFKREIPMRERNEWDAWLTEQRAEHERLTHEIIRLETELNAIVYQLFDLSADDIAIMEESTKYQYDGV